VGYQAASHSRSQAPLFPPPDTHWLTLFVCSLLKQDRGVLVWGTRQPSIREARAPPRFSLAHPLRSGMLEASQLCFWGTEHSTPRGQFRPSSDTHHPASIQPFHIRPSTPLHHCSRRKSCELTHTHRQNPYPHRARLGLPCIREISFLS
jgi:hypothetical protein